MLWEVQTGRAICGSPANNNFTLTVKFFNNRNDKLITAGNYNLLVWEYDLNNNKLRHTEANLGQLRRIFKTVTIDKDDEFAYCGTTTGDVLQIGIERVLMKNQGPGKDNMQLGVTATCAVPTGDVLVGGGDGTLVVMNTKAEPLPNNPRQFKRMGRGASVKLEGAVTSIVLDVASGKGGYAFYVGTASCNIYRVTYEPLSKK